MLSEECGSVGSGVTFNVGNVVRNLRIYIWKDNIVKVRLNFVFMRDGVHICTCIHVKTRGQSWLHSSDPVYFILFPLTGQELTLVWLDLLVSSYQGFPCLSAPPKPSAGEFANACHHSQYLCGFWG